MMGNAFYPDEWLDSAYDIPYEQFYQKGMRGIIFDIDNTLVPHGAPACLLYTSPSPRDTR